MNQIHTAVGARDGHGNTATQLDALLTSSRDLERANRGTQSQLKGLQFDLTFMGKSMYRVERLLASIEPGLQVGTTTNRPFQAVAPDYSYTTPSRNPAHADLAMLQAGEQLMKYPRTLKDACDQMNSATEQRVTGYKGPSIHLREDQKCSVFQRCGKFQQGFPNCHKPRRRSWIWSFSAPMLPVLHFAIERTFAATTGAGGSSIGMSIRYSGVVKRAESPAYQLFDRLPRVCAFKVYDEGCDLKNLYNSEVRESQYTHFDRKSKAWFFFAWNLEQLKVELRKLRQDLSFLISCGYISATCTDEYGNTLLHVSSVRIHIGFDYDRDADVVSTGSFPFDRQSRLHYLQCSGRIESTG